RTLEQDHRTLRQARAAIRLAADRERAHGRSSSVGTNWDCTIPGGLPARRDRRADATTGSDQASLSHGSVGASPSPAHGGPFRSGTMRTSRFHETVRSESAADVVARLRASFDSGRTRPLAYRQEQLAGIARLLKEREREIEAALHDDMGRPAFEAYPS